MTAEQVVRAGIVKQIFQFSYKDLAFHIMDSHSLRRFCFIGIADKGFKKSVLCKNIKAISPKTWEAINRCLIHFAKDEGMSCLGRIPFDPIFTEAMVKGQTIIEYNRESKAGHTVKEIWNALSNKLDL